MTSAVAVGLDVGTTGVKALAVAADGTDRRDLGEGELADRVAQQSLLVAEVEIHAETIPNDCSKFE